MRGVVAVTFGLLLLGCSGGDHEDLRQWMAENSKDLRGNVPALPEVQPYQPVPYEAEGQIDPFQANKIEPESKAKKGAGKGGGLEPDFEAREMRNSILEKFPLESMRMIGYLNVNNRPLAVIQVDQHVKQVKKGDYLGFDFGMVTRISDTEVALRELTQDSTGDWTERETTLQLVQGNQGSGK